ncbi:MAG: PilN domain-containing protein, partial [Desulfobia sp.]
IGSNGQLEIAAVVAQKDMVDPILQAFAQSGLAVRSMFPSLVFWALGSGDGVYLWHAQDQTEVVLSQGQKVPFHLWFRPSAQEDEQTFAQRGATLLENIPEKPETLHVIGSDLSELPGLHLFQSVFTRTQQAETPPFLSVKALTSAPYSLSFLSTALKKQEKVFRSLRIGGLVFLLLSVLAFPVADLLGTMHYSDRLQTKVDAVQRQVQELETIRNKNQELVQFFEVLAQKVRGQPRATSLLKELTEVMPETAWLYTFNFSDQRIRIHGEAESATAVLEALENSPLFENVEFDSPVEKSGSRTRFKIMAKVVS